MRTFDKKKEKMQWAITQGFTDLASVLEDELRAALTASIPLDRLEAICNAEREQRCVVRDACTWTEDDDGIWHCSERSSGWFFDTGTPEENNVHFCQECGRKIEFVHRAAAVAALAGQEEGRG